MSGSATSSLAPQVVVLAWEDGWRRSELAGLVGDARRVVHVTSAYEAAAELLAAKTAALVVDLGMVTARHVRLLAVARDLKVSVLGVGAPPADVEAESLLGVRVVSREALSAAVEELLTAAGGGAPVAAQTRLPGVAQAAGGEQPPGEVPSASVEAPPAAALAPAKQPARGPARAPHKRPAKRAFRVSEPAQTTLDSSTSAAKREGPAPADAAAVAPAPADAPTPAPADAAAVAPAPADAPTPPSSLRNLLTPEELAALLENEP